MNIISRFIFSEWMKSFFAAFFVLLLLASAADLLNEIVRAKYSGLDVVIIFVLKSPQLLSKIIPISCLIATLFSINKLKNHSELIAILATGLSATKFYFIVFIGSLLPTFIQFINLGYIEPYTEKLRTQKELSLDEESEPADDNSTVSSIQNGRFWIKSPHFFASFDAFIPETQSILGLKVIFNNSDHMVKTIYSSPKATFIKEDQWQLFDATIYNNLAGQNYHDIQNAKNIIISFGQTPEEFKKLQDDIATLDIINLFKVIERLTHSGVNITEYLMKALDKLSLSIICMLFALFPLYGIFNPNRRSSSFGKSVMFTIVFILTYQLCSTSVMAMGMSGKLNPYIASFLIPASFCLFILGVFVKNQKL